MQEIGLLAIFDVSNFNRGLSSYLKGMRDATQETENAEKSGFSFARALEVAVGGSIALVATQIIPKLISGMRDIAFGSIESAMTFESAWAGVTKTTDGLVNEFGNLTTAGLELQNGFRDMALEVPIAVDELMGIGEIGGQLGIEKENILGFTEAIAALGVSTNLSTEAAAMGLAQMANVMGTNQTEIGNMGSAIVWLGNNLATTERDVLNFSQRIAGAGKVVGLTEGDVFGIAGAFSSIGVGAEAGGTAVQKVLLSMNESVATSDGMLNTFAQTAGMSASEFSEAWESDAAGAFEQFVSGLGDAGDDAFGILEELELKDQRLIQAFLGMAQNSDLLSESISGANSAFEENIALTDEAAQKYATTESQFQLVKNQVSDIAIEFGSALLPAINDFIGAILPLVRDYAPSLAEAFGKIGEMASSIVGAFSSFVGLVSQGQDPLLSFQMLMHELFPTEIALQINSIVRGVSEFVAKIFEAIEPVLQFVQENVKLQDILIVVGGILTAMLIPALQAIGGVIMSVVAPAILAFVAAVALVAGLRAAWESDFLGMRTAVTEFWEGKVKPALDALVLFLQTAIPAAIEFVKNVIQTGLNFIAAFWAANGENIMTIVGAFMNTVSGIIETVINTISGIISADLDIILSLWENNSEWIMAVVETVWSGIEKFIETTMSSIEALIAAIAAAINGDWESFGENLRTIWDNLWDGIIIAIETAASGINTAVGGIIESVIGFFQDTDWGSVGTSIIEGIASGISGAVDIVVGAVKGAASAAVDAATGFLGIQSPSKVFKQIGLDTMLGLEGGINAAATLPSQAVSNVVNNMTSPSNTTINNVRNVTNNNNFAFSQGGGSPNRNMFFGVLSAMETVSQ